jgi:voltage-gated potassium channel
MGFTAKTGHHWPWMHHLLLGLTLLLIAVQTIGNENGGLYSRIVLGGVIVGSMAAVYERRKMFFVGLLLGCPTLISLAFQGNLVVTSAGLVLGIATIAFVCVVLLLGIYGRSSVSSSSVSASLVVYLLIGIMWSMAYLLVETNAPGSFYGLSDTGLDGTRRDLFYYSFVTLTTVGYGDIGPLGPGARALAILEAVIGQFYLVVLVASLVGMFLSERSPHTKS